MFCRIGSGKIIGIFKQKSGKSGAILRKVGGICKKISYKPCPIQEHCCKCIIKCYHSFVFFVRFAFHFIYR